MKKLCPSPRQALRIDEMINSQRGAAAELCLNYRWEQKDGKERAYLELLAGKEQGIRLGYAKVTRDLGEVQKLVQEAARSVNDALRERSASASASAPASGQRGSSGRPDLTFQGYYLKGEGKEYCWGAMMVGE